jgi:Cof subfamily protein (haloacid dehalogenase superfamily)
MGQLFRNFFSKKQIHHPVPDRLDPEADPTELLYISDLDGTLLNSSSALPKDRMDRINRMIDAGLHFTIATARNYDSVYPILQGLNFKLPVILFNGVYLTDFYTGKNVLLANFVPRGIINHMLQLVHPLGIDPFLYTYGENHHLYYRKVGNPGAQAYLDSLKGDDRLTQVDDFDLPDSEQVSGFLLIDSKKALAPVYHALKSKYPNDLSIYFAEDVSKPGYYWLQCYHRDANKGQMVRILSDHLNVPLNRMVVFGDYLNDLEMFNIAGKAIAMENALPEVKAVAHQIIGNNDQGAVVQYLESLGFIP